MIFRLLKMVLVFFSTLVISAYAYGLGSNNGTNVSCQDALTQSSDALALEAYIIELQYVIGEYDKLPSSTNGYSDEQKEYALELVEAFDGDIVEVSVLLDIPETEINLWWSSTNGKADGSQAIGVESDVIPSYEHLDKDRLDRVRTLIDRFYNVIIVRDHEIASILFEFNSITNPLTRDRIYSSKQIRLAIKLVEKTDGNVTKAARLLKIPQATLYNWVRDHEDIQNTRIRNARNTDDTYSKYLKEQKATAIQLAVELGNTAEAARYLGIHGQTLGNWVSDYRQKLHAQPDYKSLDSFSDEDRDTIIEWAMDSGNVAEVAELFNTDPFDLHSLVRNHKRKNGKQVEY